MTHDNFKPANLPVCATPLPDDAKLLVQMARIAVSYAEGESPKRRTEAAQALVALLDPAISEMGPSRAAIARAIRASVVALAVAGSESARQALAYSIREQCNALLSEPEPSLRWPPAQDQSNR